MASRKEKLRALKKRLSNKYGIAGAMLGSVILFFGAFVVPFSAVACVNCAIPLVVALGLGGTVSGLAGKNLYFIAAGVILLSISGYFIFFGKKTCKVKKK